MSTTESILRTRWDALTNHLKEYFYRPDLEALEVALSAAAAHFCIQSDPVWLFVVGPSSSGKTSVIINSLEGLKGDTLTMGDLTPKTFQSHFVGRGGESQGLLNQLGHKKILLWKDFTTFISKREEDKLAIAAQLREIYDGKIMRHSGVGGRPDWEGLITVIAACTPAIERQWGMLRDLGERFLTVRWPYYGEREVALWGRKQAGKEKWITEQTKELTAEFVRPSRLMARGKLDPIPDDIFERLTDYAMITTRMRGHVLRDRDRQIIEYPQIEELPRFTKAISSMVSAHAALWERDPTWDDARIAKRVALDCIPSTRRKLLETIPDGASITQVELSKLTKMPYTTVRHTLQDLEALEVVTLSENQFSEIEVRFSEFFQPIKNQAFGANFQ